MHLPSVLGVAFGVEFRVVHPAAQQTTSSVCVLAHHHHWYPYLYWK